MNTNDTSHSLWTMAYAPSSRHLANSCCSVSRPEISRLSLPNEMLWADFYLWSPESLRRVLIRRRDANGLFARSHCAFVSALWRNSIVWRLRMVSLRYTNWIGWTWRRYAPKTMAKITQPWSRSMAAAFLLLLLLITTAVNAMHCFQLYIKSPMHAGKLFRCLESFFCPNRWTSRHCNAAHS